MSKDWIIDVLGDMRAFADKNALPNLVHHLDEALIAATAEIAQGKALQAEAHGTEAGGAFRKAS